VTRGRFSCHMIQLWGGNMKYVKWITALLLLVFMTGIPITVAALDTGFTTEALSDEEISEIIEIRPFEKITDYTPKMVNCFDVRDDHMVVIGVDNGDNVIIAVYDAQGNFQYGFQADTFGSFGVMWSGDNIAYYTVRGDKIYEINANVEITNVRRVLSSVDNSVYYDEVICATTRTVGNSTYKMTNGNIVVDRFSGSFQTITRTDEAGTAVVYDASAHRRTRLANTALVIPAILAFFGLALYISITKIRDNNERIRREKEGLIEELLDEL